MNKMLPYYEEMLSDFIGNKLPASEVEELLDFMQSNTDAYRSMLESPQIQEQLESLSVDQRIMIHEAVSRRMKERLMNNIQEAGEEANIPVQHGVHPREAAPGRLIHFLGRNWMRYAAAAVFFFAVATTWLLINKKESIKQTVTADVKAPQTNRATIQLANGQIIYLDGAANGNLANQSGVALVKVADGQIAYSGTSDKIEYNTITNPKGSKVIDMAFVDGSHVWLNAGSSITYPVPFEAGERNVKISGEAYFEITHNSNKPFRVGKNDMEVTVYGTHFNVKAYDNEPALKVTLLEGSVAVTQKNARQMLKPGQQAVVTEPGIQLIAEADTEEALAWKNGYIGFNSADLTTVLHEIERWYDISVENTADPKQYAAIDFYVNVKREVSLRGVLQVLTNSHVKYAFDEQTRKLTILP